MVLRGTEVGAAVPDFDTWVAARGPAQLRLAYTLTGDRADTEDVVQEALSRAPPRWARISTLEDPDAYVRRVRGGGGRGVVPGRWWGWSSRCCWWPCWVVCCCRGTTVGEVVRPAEPTPWRTETWQGLEIEVLADWGYGAVCGGGSDPVVDGPDGERRSPECTGRPGVQFFDPALFDSTLAPGKVVAGDDGTWVGYYAWIAGSGRDPAVWVTGDDRATGAADPRLGGRW